MLTGHARTVRSVALLYATLARVSHSWLKSVRREFPLKKIDLPCRTIQCLAAPPATLSSFCISSPSGLLEETLQALCASASRDDEDIVPLVMFSREPVLNTPVGSYSGLWRRLCSSIVSMVVMHPIDETQPSCHGPLLAD